MTGWSGGVLVLVLGLRLNMGSLFVPVKGSRRISRGDARGDTRAGVKRPDSLVRIPEAFLRRFLMTVPRLKPDHLAGGLIRALVAVLALAPAALDAQRPDASCNDKAPSECANVKFLGESDGCACFVCNPNTAKRKVVCTKNAAEKRALYRLRDQAAKPASAVMGAASGTTSRREP
jgi:hypothetical protein